MAAELFEVEIVDNHGFDVRVAFGGYGIPSKFRVSRCENAGLGVMDVGVFDKGQVTRATRDGHIEVILDTPRLSAVSDSEIAMSRVSIEGHEDDLRSLLCGDPRQLWEFDVVTNLNRDAAAIGVKNFHALTRADAPPFALAGRNVDLVLLTNRTATLEQVRDVVERVVLDHKLRPADDVQVVLDGHFTEELQVLRRELRQLSCRHAGLVSFVRKTSKLRREQFGEQHEIAFVVGSRIEEELALLGEFVEALLRLASDTGRRRCGSVRPRGEIAAWRRNDNPDSSIPEMWHSRGKRLSDGK